MENKDIKEMLKNMEKIVKIMEKNKGSMEERLHEELQKAFKEPAIISIEKDNDGRAETRIEGTTMAILITLAGLEKTILGKLDVPSGVWELVQNVVGTMEAGENE